MKKQKLRNKPLKKRFRYVIISQYSYPHMKLVLVIEKLRTKDNKEVLVLSTTLRTDIKTGKKVLVDEKEVDELLTINGMGEIPEDDPLHKIAQEITVELLSLHKKKSEKKKPIKSPYKEVNGS